MKRGTCQLARISLLAWLAAISAGQAAVPAQKSVVLPSVHTSAPLCGIYSLYTALRAEGIDVDFAGLLKPRYVGSSLGSSVGELDLAAREHGAHVQILTNLGVADLRHLGCPAILHVKTEYDAPDYNHYLLCVPTADGRIVLYDPPDPPARTSGNELAATWDGTALLISSRPIDLGVLRRFAAARIVLGVAIAGAVLGFVGRMVGRSRRLPRLALMWQSAVLLILASLVAAGYHTLSLQGFVSQRAAVMAIRNARFAEPSGRTSLAEAQILWRHGAQFIDARPAEDYNERHVPGAVNVPPNASRSDRLQILSGLSPERPLVVYCQSSACPYASILAKRLNRDGYTNVRVFGGGFNEWADSTHSSTGVSDAFFAEGTP